MKNERGAGKKPNKWQSRYVSIPDPIRESVYKMVEEWKRQERDKNKSNCKGGLKND